MKVARIRRGTPLQPRPRFLESSTFSFYKHFKWTHASIVLRGWELDFFREPIAVSWMPPPTYPKHEIYHGASYWSEVRKCRACHLARHANRSAREDEALVDFFPNPNIFTVSADRQGFYYSCLAPNGSLVPAPAPPSGTTMGTTGSSRSTAAPSTSAKWPRIIWYPPTAGHHAHAPAMSSKRSTQAEADTEMLARFSC
ncbi:hypothetical protein K438DRAFT_1752493 [Mycena galopus ATCC 62051]|nr:hypothetical protein K438DRAFT_1752493 [Mycena galopus ATCC 62051]